MKRLYMNSVSNNNNKRPWFLSAVSVVGFIGLIIFLAWLGIKVVAFMPAAISSLASLADSVYNYRTPELTIVTNRSESTSGETVELSWSVPKQRGTFGISYTCNDGVSLDVQLGQTIEELPCNTILSLGVVSGVALQPFTERTRITEIPVTIHFFRADSDVVITDNTHVVRVTNPAIPEDYVAELPSTEPTPVPEPTPTPTPPIPEPTPTPTPQRPATQTIVTYTYGLPVSNPDGFTDLEASYITIGTMSDATFTALGSLTQANKQSAIQFAIKNIGTKTSTTWTYLLRLPNGTMYTSPEQAPLKPNERVTITQSFPTPQAGSHVIFGSIILNDSNLANNSFTAPFVVR